MARSKLQGSVRRRVFLATTLVLVAFAAGMAVPGPVELDRDQVDALFLLDARRFPAASAPPEVMALGEQLFTQPFAGGGNERVACATCHVPEQYGQDGLAIERVVHAARGTRNVPTVIDSARQVAFGWDGRVTDLAAIVQGELSCRLGLIDDGALRAAVAQVDGLAERFGSAFPGDAPVRLVTAAQAIAAHLGTLRSAGRWDRFVEGDDAALTAGERAGLRTFVEVGCAACHGSRTLGGVSSHKLGLAEPYATPDQGRATATGLAADRALWKAPMLRLAAHTAPYLHDGSVPTLADMVRLMARHELGKQLATAEVEAIVEFLVAVGDVDAIGR